MFFAPQHGSIIAQKGRIRRHISWKLLCSGPRYSRVIPIILTGAPPAVCRRHGKATHTHTHTTAWHLRSGQYGRHQDWHMNPALPNTTQNCWFNYNVVTSFFRFAIYLSPPHGISRYGAATWRQNTTYGHSIQDFVLTGRYKQGERLRI